MAAKKPKSKEPAATKKPRKLSKPRYKSFRPSRSIKYAGPRLIGAFRLFWRALMTLKKSWKLYLGILLVYGVLNVTLVKGFSSSLNLQATKDTLNTFFHGGWSNISNNLTLFGLLVGSSGNAPNDVAGAYQTFLILISSLGLIWALRQSAAQKIKVKLRVRDAFYKGIYPLVPFILVITVIGLQLLPMLLGGLLYSTVLTNGLAVTPIEKGLWAVMFFLLALLSLYMISSSIFALYIVTLPDMTPMKALRSARQLVLHRRWIVLRKVLFLPVAILLLGALITMPVIILIAPAAEWVFFAFGILALAISHSYLYNLYRELL